MRQAGVPQLIFPKNCGDEGTGAEAGLDAFLDLFPNECALLDRTGTVTAVKGGWADDDGASILPGATVEVGSNLFQSLGSGPQSFEARKLLEGLEAVATGARDEFSAKLFDRFDRASLIQAKKLPIVQGGALLSRSAIDAAPSLARGYDQLERIYQSSPIGMCLLDLELRYLRINKRLAQLDRLPAEAHIGRSISEVTPAFAERARQIAKSILETGQPVLNVEFSDAAWSQGGELRHWSTSWHSFEENGAVSGFIVVVEETTERKRAEEALVRNGAFMDITKLKKAEADLRENEAQFGAMFELTGVGMALCDPETGLVLRANETFARMFGYEASELVGRSMKELTHPGDRGGDWERFVQMAHGEFVKHDAEKRYLRKDGSYFWGRVTATLTNAPARRAFAVVQDISLQKQIERQLRESEARLEQALEAANAGVWELALTTGAFKASSRALELYGMLADQQLHADSALAAVYPEDRPLVLAALERTLKTKAPFNVELRVQQGGTLRWLSLVADVRGKGETLRLVGLVQDIDERKRYEVALRESEERQAFLLRCADALRQISDPEKIQETACCLLGEHLGVDRVFYADIEGEELVVRNGYARGAQPFSGRARIASLGEATFAAFRCSEAIAFENSFTDERLTEAERESFTKAGVVAALHTMLKQRRGVGVLCAQHGSPRVWAPFEVALLKEVGERISASSERARAQEALRESEFRLQLALNSGNIGIYEWRIESDELIWDDRLRKQWGLQPGGAVTYDAFMQGVHPADRSRMQAVMDRSLDPASGGNLYLEYRVLRPDRSERWIAATGAVFFEDGRPIRMVGTSQDITVRKRAEAERQKFVSLAEQSLEFIGIYSLEFEPLYINPAGARLVGLDKEKARHTPLPNYFFPQDREFVLDEFLPGVMRKGDASVEIRFRHFETGEARWMLYNVFLLRDAGGEPIGFATVSRDITARRRAEDALKAADRQKDEFLATLAHELRNPLAPIRNAVHLLRQDVAATATEKRDLTLLSMMDRQVEHLVRLVDDLLEVSRITRGKIELKRQSIDLADVLRHAIETAQPTIDRGGHRLDVEFPSEPLELDADPVRLAQVFTNLLNNAAKYTEQGGVISMAAEQRDDKAVVAVRDNGVGIPAEMLPRVFDLFTQVDRSLGRAQGGLGIGLALVKSLLELHGGTVEAHSDGLGCGSAFIVRLPVMAKQTAEAPMPGTTGAETSAARRILVIDDDHDVADSLVMFLETFGAIVRVAYNGADGIETVKDFEPELVFLDLGMPGMDGYETARRIRALPKGDRVKLVALTGWGQDQIRDRAREAGFDRQLTKPAGLDALQELLAET
jgi:PAS domain S-box-containing protein